MAGTRLLFVLCYDISDDRQRRRLARLLENHAIRVQRSVFELRTTERNARRLARRAARYLARGDSLRVYALDANDRDRSQVFGSGLRIEEQPFYLL